MSTNSTLSLISRIVSTLYRPPHLSNHLESSLESSPPPPSVSRLNKSDRPPHLESSPPPPSGMIMKMSSS
ncbi:hypothetical protein C1H46_013451 [Malus baccata]|uniref:Uncharacterized protein n=1 Tax=Malus baccata TaxID=106549 RepID=A0A540MQ44_MALBA|nr:hypothetical protein C1H46_013451 [Malus baccata]